LFIFCVIPHVILLMVNCFDFITLVKWTCCVKYWQSCGNKGLWCILSEGNLWETNYSFL